MTNLKVSKIKNTVIPFPPRAEQIAIVQKLDTLTSLYDTLAPRNNVKQDCVAHTAWYEMA